MELITHKTRDRRGGHKGTWIKAGEVCGSTQAQRKFMKRRLSKAQRHSARPEIKKLLKEYRENLYLDAQEEEEFEAKFSEFYESIYEDPEDDWGDEDTWADDFEPNVKSPFYDWEYEY